MHIRLVEVVRHAAELRTPKRLLVLLGAVLSLLLPAGTAMAAVHPYDPSPYCRPYASMPYALGYKAAGAGHYTAEFEADAGLNCNGPATVHLTTIFHWQTNGVSGAQSGPSTYCSGSCTASAFYTRTLSCNVVYNFADFTQLTGTWSGGGTSGNASATSATRTGSAYNPPGAGC